MNNFLVRLIGFFALVVHGDPAVFDRFLWLRRHLTKGQVRTLDAGCGSGAFTIYAARSGNEALGISFDAENNKRAEERVRLLGVRNTRFLTADLNDLEAVVADAPLFDQIICFETIEHIMDDQGLVEKFSKILRPGGRLLLTTPYKYYRHLYGDDKHGLSAAEDGGHLRWGYTHEEMEILLGTAGFSVETKDYLSGFISQQLINAMRMLSILHPKFGWGIVFPLRLLQFFDPLLAKVFPYPFLCIAIVAVKR